MPGDSNILLRVDSATKAAWQERAKAEGQTLTGLIIGAVEGKAAFGNEVASSPEQLGAVVEPEPAIVHPPLPVPVAKVEPAPSVPAVVPPVPRSAAGRGHSAMCTCLMCKG